MNIFIDFDNTFFIENRDVDDAMALFFLLAQKDVNIVGITSTYGNSTIEDVDACTLKLLKKLGLSEALYAKGGSCAGDYLSPASKLMADKATEFSGDLTIVGLGSLTNFHGAYLYDPQFYNKVSQIILMGGTIAPLTFPKQIMRELNFSCDPMASYSVLTKGQNVNIITGNACLDVIFTRQQYEDYFKDVKGPIVELIKHYSNPWFQDNYEEYGIEGFYNWDSIAAAYITHPELFHPNALTYPISVYGLSTGSLVNTIEDIQAYQHSKPLQEVVLNLPRIKDPKTLTEVLYQGWIQLEESLNYED